MTATAVSFGGTPLPANNPSVASPSWLDNCAARFSASICTDPPNDEPATAFAAAAATSNPYRITTDAKPKWGLAESDTAFLEGRVTQPFITSQLGNEVGGVQRILVPWNVLTWPNRKAALIKQLDGARAAGRKVLISFEMGCQTDGAPVPAAGAISQGVRISCNSSQGNQNINSFPSKTNELNAVAAGLLDLKAGTTDVGTVIRYFSVWNEPSHDNQPFRPKAAGTGTPGDGLTGLQRITRELADPKKGVCAKVKFCEIVAAEVEVARSQGADSTMYAFSYANWLTRSYKWYLDRRDASNWGDNAKDVDFGKLKYYGLHAYSEVENSWNATAAKPAKVINSNTARWMTRLPSNARVWLPEIGVFGHRETEPVNAAIVNDDYSPAQRAKQADFLFNKLGRIKVGRNNARVYRGNYYQFCSGALDFDTSVFDRFNVANGSANCGIGGTSRTEVVNALKAAVARNPN